MQVLDLLIPNLYLCVPYSANNEQPPMYEESVGGAGAAVTVAAVEEEGSSSSEGEAEGGEGCEEEFEGVRSAIYVCTKAQTKLLF